MRPFQFKKFKVEQSRTPMKVGTDGVLIGAWCSVEGERILDIGTGCGLIALMVAQRTEGGNAVIDAVEIDSESADEAVANFEASAWSDRLSIFKTGIQSYHTLSKYDNIVTNPPFFVDSLNSPDHGRNIARHSVELPFDELISSVDRLLSDEGCFSVILPTTESEIFEQQAAGLLMVCRRCVVYGREGSVARRVMSEYRRTSMVEVEHSRLTLENRDVSEHRYSEEYRALTRNFYLKF